jgi:PAS domain S-box-containing protein
MDKNLLNNYLKFIYNLVTAVRRISLYPSQHPAVVNSIKSIYEGLCEILNVKNMISISVSPDNTLVIDNETINEKNVFIEELIGYFKKMNIENITFDSGIAEKEIDDFVRILLLDAEEARKLGDIKKALLDKGIQHIRAFHFSYVKIDEENEALVAKKEISALETLKSALKDLHAGRINSPEEMQDIETRILGLAGSEFKEKKRLSVSVKNMYKKYLSSVPDKEGALRKLKGTLLEAGCPPQEVDALVNKICEEEKKPEVKAAAESVDELRRLKKENEELKSQLHLLQQSGIMPEPQRKKLFDDKQRLDNVIHHMAEGLVVVDPQGNIVMANPTAEKLLNISGKDMGKPVKEVVRDEHLLTLVKKFSTDKDEVIEKDVELFSHNDSTKKILRTSSAVIEDNNGNTIGMVTTLNDITKQKELERMKADFLSSVSHELRTPLVAIEKSIYLILNKTTGEVSDTQAQFLSIADRNLKRLTLLINDLLDLSKLEAGRMTVKRQPTLLDKIIGESVMTLNNWAKTKSVNIQVKILEALPEADVDPNRIIQVLNNLIGNAIKFTPADGTITVEAAFRREKGEIEVCVADTGIGISEENLSKIFDKFYQINEKVVSDVAGTGIGLTISKEIVELHGGRIWVESQQGHGARFIFTLPLKGKDNVITEV